MTFLTAPLVSPSAGQSFYGSATTHTYSLAASSNNAAFYGQPPEIVETARALKNDPDLIYEYVHNQIEVEYAFGERKGPLGALIDKSGTPFDQNVLFVNLVRQAGYAAQYVIAPVTIAASDFFNWTGVSDIQAACRLLSSGGIPAAFNGAAASPSDCTQIGTGAFSSVTILHVYSQVNIGGTWYAYDPSFKSHTTASPINLASAAGLSSGQAAAAAASTVDSGTASGASYIHNASTTGLDSYLQARGAALLSYINANAPSIDMDGIVGITKIVPTYKPSGGWRNTTPSGYSTSGGVTVTGDMPDQYRTKLHVSLYGDYNQSNTINSFDVLDWLFYVDDIDGRRVGVDTNFDAAHVTNPDPDNTNDSNPYTTQSVTLVVDDVPITSFSCTIVISGTSTCLPGRGGQLILAADHPYVANAGTYGDATVIKNLVSLQVPFTIVSGWGSVSGNRLAKWSTEAIQDKALPLWGSGPYPCGDVNGGEICWEQYASSVGDFTKQKLSAGWLGQVSRMLAIQSAIANSVGDHQHSLGVVAWRYYPYQRFQYPDPSRVNYTPPYHYGINDQYTVLDVDTAISLTSKTNSAAAVNALARSVAVSASTLEGSLIEQTEDLPDTASTASRFAWGNLPDSEDPCFTSSTPRRFYDLTGVTNAGTRTGLYVYEGSASGCNADPVINGNVNSDGSPNSAYLASQFAGILDAAVSGYLANGFHVTTSAETFLGPGARFGPAQVNQTCPYDTSLGCTYYRWNFETRQRGGALVATLFDGSGNVQKIAHTLTDADGISKGGGGKQPERFAAYDPSKAADILKDRFVDKSVLLGVDLKTGAAGYTTPTLYSQGTGSAPYQLDYKLQFKAAPWAPSPFGPTTGPITGGWNQSWDIRFSNSGSGQEAMGATSPKAAAGTLAAFLAMQDIFASGSSNLTEDVYAALTADWWRQQMVANVATVNRGFSGQQYVRLVDGTWMAPIGSPGVLTQTGSRVKIRDNCMMPGNHASPLATARRWDFSSVNFSLREADGETLAIAPWSWNYDPDNKCAITYGYQPTTWTWPQGPTLSFTYDYQQGVTGVTSSLGRSMTFPINLASVPTGGPQLTAVANGVTVGEQANSNQIQDAAGDAWNFSYTSVATRSLTAYNRPIPYPELSQVFEPVNASQAALAYTYDSRGIVKTAQDATSIQQGTRGPYSWYIAEGGRGERDDPLGGAYTVYYDTDGNAVRYLDELSRETDATYDGRHRVTSRTFPEGDREQFAYDSLDNVTGLVKVAKPGSGLANLSIGATYDPTWNKLASITDAMGNTTNFSYYASGNGASLMSQALRPADASGNRPSYTFQYGSIGLPTQEVDAAGVTTTHAYDSYGDLTSTTEAAAAANGQPALNLTTTFEYYSAQGDATVSIDPRGEQTDFGFDAMRRKTAVGSLTGQNMPWMAYTGWGYDQNGREVYESRITAFDSNNYGTAAENTFTSYTPTGKVATKTDPLGHVTTTTYDALDRTYQVTDPTGLVTGFVYDAAGQKLQERRGVGTALEQAYETFTYGANGEALTEADARGSVMSSAYDGFNRLSQISYADGTSEQNQYDPNGDLTIWTNRGGFSVIRCYDALGRKVSERGVTGASNSGSCPTGGTANLNSRWWDLHDATFSYDLSGRPLTADNSTAWYNHYSYDAAGRLLTFSNNFGNTQYGYDAAGNKVYIGYPTGYTASYSYDPMNRMTSAVFNGTTVATLTYDVLSRRTGITFGDGSTQTYGYDGADRLTSLAHTFPNSASSNVTFGYGYDNAGRTTSTSVSNPAFVNNPTTQTTNYATADALNRYPSVNGQSYAWWAEGPLQSDGVYTHYFDETGAHSETVRNTDASLGMYLDRDALGRAFLHQAYDPVNGYSLYYEHDSGDSRDALIDRFSTTANGGQSWNWVGDREYLPGPNPDEKLYFVDVNGTGYYPHTDRQGSTIALSNAGYDVLTRTYGPYGEIQQPATVAPGASAYPYLYTGQYYMSSIGAYDYKARTYSASLGRFLQPDPIGPKDDINLFGYTHNDPLNGTDPTGMADCTGSNIDCGGGLAPGLSGSVSFGAGHNSTLAEQKAQEQGQQQPQARTTSADQNMQIAANNVVPGGPKPSPNFIDPTNAPQEPPAPDALPDGHSVRVMGPTEQYPNGYWVQTNKGGQPIDPSTGKPPSNVSRAQFRAMVHVPRPATSPVPRMLPFLRMTPLGVFITMLMTPSPAY